MCTCKNYHIDGGSGYLKVGWKEGRYPEACDLEVGATEEELYQDWNNGANKFGHITGWE